MYSFAKKTLLVLILSLFASLVSSLSSCDSGCTAQCLRNRERCFFKSNPVTIVTAQDGSPYISQTGTSPPVGFDVDLMNMIGNLYGINFTYQYTTFAEFIGIVQNNTNTISITVQTDTVAREQFVSFAQYFRSGSDFIVLSTYNGTINGLSDLCGKTVILQSGTTQVADVTTQNASCGSNPINIQVVGTATAQFDAVENGSADVALNDQGILIGGALQSNNTLKVLQKPYNISPRGILCNKQNQRLCCTLVNAINYLIQQGTYDQLLQNYSFTYKNNGVCPSILNLNATPCLSKCVPSSSDCQTKLA